MPGTDAVATERLAGRTGRLVGGTGRLVGVSEANVTPDDARLEDAPGAGEADAAPGAGEADAYGLGPEWVPGPDGVPFRRAARVIVLDREDRVLLVRGHDAGETSRSWWFTVGGGLEPGESARAGAVRELREETGLVIDPAELVGPVLSRSAIFDFARVTCRQDEEFFLARAEVTHLDDAGWTALERDVLDEMRWWHLDDLDAAVAAGTVVYPRSLPERLRRLLVGWDGRTPHLEEHDV
ncbi:NUDIX hydrolase [Georgenia faecalis]|uniref:NUDIX hydrolase n=1 Tax=Georgenia faecalis TaxID=2483799 RepID=UPI000FDC4C9F|nr:NUDIX domain-containing protein [Georgenia faecalis]